MSSKAIITKYFRPMVGNQQAELSYSMWTLACNIGHRITVSMVTYGNQWLAVVYSLAAKLF